MPSQPEVCLRAITLGNLSPLSMAVLNSTSAEQALAYLHEELRTDQTARQSSCGQPWFEQVMNLGVSTQPNISMCYHM